MKRWLAAFVLPSALLLAWQVAPLVAGARTLVLRDVLNTHHALRAHLAERLRAGEIPLVDPQRAGGQASLGNPNVVALYPDNILLLVASPLWQLNAHFWLHWIVAFGGAYWLARSRGLEREGAAAAAAAYGFSGWFLSQLNLYNAVAAVALAPALAAALLEAGRSETRRRGLVASGAIWGLMLLGGDPILAVLALLFGLALLLARRDRSAPLGAVALAIAAGALIAAPQIVETSRILAESYRGFRGYAGGAAGARHPLALAELLVPLLFGRPDRLTLWGAGLFGGHPPLYFTLFPGYVAAGCALAAGRPRSREGAAVLALGLLGLAIAFSGGTVVARWITAGPFRYPEKFAIWAALAVALAVGEGVARLVRDESPRPALRAMIALAAAGTALAFGLRNESGALAGALRAPFGAELSEAVWRAGHARWAVVAALAAGTAALAALALVALPGRRRAAAAGLIAIHAASQLAFLAPVLPTDAAAFYERPPELASRLGTREVLAQGGAHAVLGRDDAPAPPVAGASPYSALQRRAQLELHDFAGLAAGRRYEFDVSPEGLDSFVVQAVGSGLGHFTDERRVAVLRATGVEVLLAPRRLTPEGAGGARLRFEAPSLGRTLSVYELPGTLPEASLLGEVVAAPQMNAALAAVLAPGFDPRRTAVVAGAPAARNAPAGVARIAVDRAERVEVEVDSPAGGFLVLRRAYLPIWRAEIDGRPARPVIAQLTRLALEVPPGAHRVVLSVSRAPLRWALVASALGLAWLAWVSRRAAA